jgi:type II secretion system protein N
MRKLKTWVLYPGYIICVTLFFLYMLFPQEAAMEYLSGYLGEHYPDYVVTADTIKPDFPPGLRLDGVDFSFQGKNWVNLDQLRIRPKYRSVFSTVKTVRFRGKAYKGDLWGAIDLEPSAGSYEISAFAELKGIQLEENDHLQTLSGRKIAGRLDSTLVYGSEKGADKRLDVNLHVAEGAVGLTNPVFSINNLAFESIDAELVVDRRTLKLKRCTADGAQVKGDVSGVVLFRQPFERSRLEFKGNVKPQHLLMASLKKALPKSMLPSKKQGKKAFPSNCTGLSKNRNFHCDEILFNHSQPVVDCRRRIFWRQSVLPDRHINAHHREIRNDRCKTRRSQSIRKPINPWK